MPADHRQDGLQTLQLVHDMDRDTLRIDALMFETTDGGTTWVPIENTLKEGGTADVHLHYWNGSTWVPWSGASRKETEFALVALATEAAI